MASNAALTVCPAVLITGHVQRAAELIERPGLAGATRQRLQRGRDRWRGARPATVFDLTLLDRHAPQISTAAVDLSQFHTRRTLN